MTTAHRRGIIPPLPPELRLEVARRHIGATQREFAEMIGVSNTTVNRAERGYPVKRSTLLAWAMVTGADLDWLEHGKTPPPDGDGASGSVLPQLDSNQQPFDYTVVQLRAAA